MPAFDSTTRAKIESAHTATRLLQIIYSAYQQAKSAQALLNLYLAGTDPVFNAAVNAMLTAAERSELGQMLVQLNALCTDWETNHPTVIAQA